MENRHVKNTWQAKRVMRVLGRGNGYKATAVKLRGEGKGESPSASMGRLAFYFNISNWILID